MTDTLSGFIVVAPEAGGLDVPAQVARRDGGHAVSRRDRATRRGDLGGRQPVYRLAIVTVVPAAAQIRAWLAAHGWHTGPAGALWTAPDGPSVRVPPDDGDPAAAIGAIEQIAAAAGMTAAALMGDMAATGQGGA